MTMIKVKKILHSISTETNISLITLHLHYPRIIHSELLTHVMFSRNARSSRATTFSVACNEVLSDPYIPNDVRKNQRGMQGFENIDDITLQNFQFALQDILNYTVDKLKPFEQIHKQHINRYLEPFMYIDTILTACNGSSKTWDNLLKLRKHKDAQPEFQVLATEIEKTLLTDENKQYLNNNEWHLPYILSDEYNTFSIDQLKIISAARIARVSYKPFNSDSINVQRDLELGADLIQKQHLSPFESISKNTNTHNQYYKTICWQSYRYQMENNINENM